MMAQQGQGQPLQPKSHATTMGDRPVGQGEAPEPAEVILVAIEAQAGGGIGAVVDGHEQFELELLAALDIRLQLAGPAEERIVGDVD